MPVSPQCAGAYIINLIAFWLLLLLHPATVTTIGLKNCSFIDGHILEFVCHGKYERQIRLQYKDRNPAINAPYSIWQRADYFGSTMLLIVFYEGPLTRCYNLVLSEGLFYCNGHNYPMELDDSIIVNCIPFKFTYADELHKQCKTSKKIHASTISSVIIYMESNIIEFSGAAKILCSLNILVIVILPLRFVI
ncbi:uncharacterized protein LOC111597618 [Drosophila hydei]|uniref:Uncharacterized protein LOC111597618 n=1 Tax=Drosophila hydei TaxID=7224 RepID=A0A6J1LQ17_DROHY|nr:uncharacterized protein LOC111597618 [Drosophila hydei]